MATTIKSHADQVTLTRFWGGDNRGVCIQITTPGDKGGYEHNYVTMTRAQAGALARDLYDFSTSREEETYEN